MIKLLYGFDILVAADGTDKLRAVAVVRRNDPPSFFSFCGYAPVAHDLPPAALAIQYGIFAVISTVKV